jgi:nucleoside 2-deoxyribosyltransferase
MQVYIAGKLGTNEERQRLEEIDSLCVSLGLKTFVPHRDVGKAKGIKDVDLIFKGDITRGLDNCNLLIASLDGLHVGAGTAWEIGYAYSKGIPCLGIKTDETVEEGFEYLSPMLIKSVDIVTSMVELKHKIERLI